MNWYIGQDIVAINNHVSGNFKRGDEFKIKALRDSSCKCNDIEIDIGIRVDGYDITCCRVCSTDILEKTTIWWFSDRNFAPLDPIKEAISELMESSISQVTEI